MPDVATRTARPPDRPAAFDPTVTWNAQTRDALGFSYTRSRTGIDPVGPFQHRHEAPMRFQRSAMVTMAAMLLALGAGACNNDNGNSGPLAAPANVAVHQMSLTSINVTWDDVSGNDGYIVERASAAAPGVFTQVGGTINVSTYTDNTVTAGVVYSYHVAALKGGVA